MCGYSVAWWNGLQSNSGAVGSEVIVSCTGYKAGATKKAIASGRAISILSKKKLAEAFLELLNSTFDSDTEYIDWAKKRLAPLYTLTSSPAV
eukprot:gene8281-12774_t